MCSDAEDIGSQEQVYEGIPATPHFISPNFPSAYHQKDFYVSLCIIRNREILVKGMEVHRPPFEPLGLD